MKKLFFLLLFSGFATVFYGQNIPFTISKSNVFQDEYKNSILLLSEKNDMGELLLVRSYNGSLLSQGQGFYVENYSPDLKFKKGFDYEMKHPNYQKYNLILSIFRMQNNIHFVEMYYDLNEKAFICQDNILSEDFKMTEKELFRVSRDEMKSFGTFNIQQKFYRRSKDQWTNDNSGNINSENEQGTLDMFYKVFFSGNSKYNYRAIYSSESEGIGSDAVLVVNEAKNAFAIAIDLNGKENDGLKLYLFDSNLNKKMDILYTNTVKEKKCFFQNFQVSDDGNAIYILAKTYIKDLKKKEEGGKYCYEYSKISAEGQTSKQINTEQHFIGSLKTFAHNNELVCLGFYSDVKDFKYSGICYFKIDPTTLEIKSTKYSPFTEQFITDKYGYNSGERLKYIRFKKVFFTPSDEIILNAEENFTTYSTGGVGAVGVGAMGVGGGMSTGGSKISYNYDDIVTAKLSASGDLLWARNINKKQSSSDDENSFLSYTSTISNDKTYFFINTKDKIKKLKNERIEFGQIRKNKSNLNVIQVNGNGDFEYEEILDDEENEVPFMVAKGIVIENYVYFLGRKGKNKQLLKVTL